MQKNLSKEVKNQLAEKCFIYNLHYAAMREFLRFSNENYLDVASGAYQPAFIYSFKFRQLNAMIWLLERIYINPNQDENTNELYGWCIDLLRSRLEYFLQYQLENLIQAYEDAKNAVRKDDNKMDKK